MDESQRETPPADAWRETLAQTIEQQRRRVGERIAGQRDRLRDLESRIIAQLDDATKELARQQDDTSKREQETQRQRRHVAQQLRAQKKEVVAQAELQRAQVAASAAGQDLQLQTRLSEVQGKYDRLREEFETREAQRNEATQRLAELRTQIETRHQELRQQQAALEQAQRKQAELEAERGKLQAELQKHQEEGRKQVESARDHGKSKDAQVQSLNQQLEELRKKLSDAEAASQKTKKDLESQLAAARQAGGDKGSTAELTKLREEKKQLEKWLAEAEEKAKKGGTGGGQELEDLRRRFEMAVQDVRELKTKNTELTEQLSKARQSGGAAPPTSVKGGDWESMKKKLLADLETGFDENDAAQKNDKLTVQGAIKITDQVVADKDEEIKELRRLLDSQAQQVGAVAVGAQAVAQMLDTDELVRQERESLKRLQDSLREQLRQAEVDISVERAKLARERAELDEKLRSMEERASQGLGGETAGDKGKKGGGRKWLTRLGLGDGKGD
jgi:hypothetical protein